MFADTDAIRVLGAANTALAADLADVAAMLLSLPAASTLGPVGARFMSALAEAAAEGSRAAAAMSEGLSATGMTARAAAVAYDDADHSTGTLISGV